MSLLLALKGDIKVKVKCKIIALSRSILKALAMCVLLLFAIAFTLSERKRATTIAFAIVGRVKTLERANNREKTP